ncbi:MAG: hypothetical protein Q9195_008945 [Heterodermia aff. obscurata]
MRPYPAPWESGRRQPEGSWIQGDQPQPSQGELENLRDKDATPAKSNLQLETNEAYGLAYQALDDVKITQVPCLDLDKRHVYEAKYLPLMVFNELDTLLFRSVLKGNVFLTSAKLPPGELFKVERPNILYLEALSKSPYFENGLLNIPSPFGLDDFKNLCQFLSSNDYAPNMHDTLRQTAGNSIATEHLAHERKNSLPYISNITGSNFDSPPYLLNSILSYNVAQHLRFEPLASNALHRMQVLPFTYEDPILLLEHIYQPKTLHTAPTADIRHWVKRWLSLQLPAIFDDQARFYRSNLGVLDLKPELNQRFGALMERSIHLTEDVAEVRRLRCLVPEERIPLPQPSWTGTAGVPTPPSWAAGATNWPHGTGSSASGDGIDDLVKQFERVPSSPTLSLMESTHSFLSRSEILEYRTITTLLAYSDVAESTTEAARSRYRESKDPKGPWERLNHFVNLLVRDTEVVAILNHKDRSQFSTQVTLVKETPPSDQDKHQNASLVVARNTRSDEAPKSNSNDASPMMNVELLDGSVKTLHGSSGPVEFYLQHQSLAFEDHCSITLKLLQENQETPSKATAQRFCLWIFLTCYKKIKSRFKAGQSKRNLWEYLALLDDQTLQERNDHYEDLLPESLSTKLPTPAQHMVIRELIKKGFMDADDKKQPLFDKVGRSRFRRTLAQLLCHTWQTVVDLDKL